MKVYERRQGSAGTINVSVKPPEVGEVRDALAFIETKQPHVQMSSFIVDLIRKEAQRLGWRPGQGGQAA